LGDFDFIIGSRGDVFSSQDVRGRPVPIGLMNLQRYMQVTLQRLKAVKIIMNY